MNSLIFLKLQNIIFHTLYVAQKSLGQITSCSERNSCRNKIGHTKGSGDSHKICEIDACPLEVMVSFFLSSILS